MNIQKTIADLRAELACVNEALVAIEKLSLMREPRRGRPPARLTLNNAAITKNKENVAQAAQ